MQWYKYEKCLHSKHITQFHQFPFHNIKYKTHLFNHLSNLPPYIFPLNSTIMKYFTIATALLSTSLVASAAPAPAPLERRACSVAYPQSIGFPINYDIHQDAGKTNVVTNALNFNNIPAGSYGCQLEVNFPPNYPITKSGNSLLNVFAVAKDGTESLFGTVALASSPVAPTKYVINSAKCNTLLSYKLAIASDSQAGRVAFADTKDAGFTITYNC